MTLRILLLPFLFLLCCTSAPSAVFAQPAEGEKEKAEAHKPPEMGPTELDYPIDDRIKVKVEPFVPGTVVDRLLEPSLVTIVNASGSEVELFVVPVDAPYGGKALDRPHSIGKDEKPADGWKLHWNGKEHQPYIKLFAVVHRRNGGHARSRTYDFGVAGTRYEPEPEKPADQPQTH